MNSDNSSSEREHQRLDVVLSTLNYAAARYAARFGIERLREEIQAESVSRVVGLINDARTPFDAAPDSDDAISRMQRFTYGLVANVAREALRGRLRHAHLPLEDQAAACASLRAAVRTPQQSIEIEESIRLALESLKSIDGDVRETIVAEEIMQNKYASDDADRLCRSCDVSFKRVWTMIENRRSGVWTDDAWRQRVHRSRKKARTAVGALATFTLGATIALGTLALAPAPAGDSRQDTAMPHVADDGSTQNGKTCPTQEVRLASTQNGSHGTSMGGDGAPA